MDKKVIIDKLILLNSHNPADCDGDLSTLCDINIKLASDTNIKDVNKFNPNDNSIIWEYIRLNFYYLDLLRDSLDNTPGSDVLSVQQTKSLKNVLNNLIAIGIRCNLQPKMPGYRQLPTQYVEDCEPVLNSYNRLAATSYALISYLKCQKLRHAILAGNFKFILSALYQIIYCPLKKPDLIAVNNSNSFIMTQDLYDRFTHEKGLFKKELEYLEKSLLKTLYVRETMLLPENNSPPFWFMKAIAENLNNLICSDKGVETIVWAMIDSSADYDPNDKAKNWKILDVITKLILNLRAKSEFKTIICGQIVDLFNAKDRNGKYIAPFEDLFVLCTKRLFYLDENLCRSTLLPIILNQFEVFVSKKHKFRDNEKITDLIVRISRVLYSCFVGSTGEKLPFILLAPSIPVIVNLYLILAPFSNKILIDELKDVLIHYLVNNADKTCFFNLFLFNILAENTDNFREDIYIEEEHGDLIIKTCNIKNLISVEQRGNLLMKLCKTKTDLSVNLFIYLLNVLIDNRYLTSSNKPDLLEIEDGFVVDETLQRKLVVYRILSELAEDPLIQSYIQDNPIEIIKYLKDALQNALDSGIHKSEDDDSQKFQTIFTLIMILQALIMNSDKHDHFKSLLSVLKSLFRESLNVEFRNLVKGVLDVLEGDKFVGKGVKTKPQSEFEKALVDVQDSLLPVRGHGLMTLSKLIEDKDREALERKSYILNIFQQNLKEEDSFIYLSSINGLAAMGYLFPDVILNILTDEYSDFSRRNAEDGPELRMKLGEILLRVIKTLGETAPKYKSLLLNTFLLGTKDEDHLIRASSLSNLGEVCRVLGYKLGTIIVEILICVHAIISTDKAIEARRAAVTVIRQLFVGLEAETITFLKDHILEIYRTLKNIYEVDKNEVMRLQAQLALEQLNENVKGFLMTGPRLQADKIFVLPDSGSSIKLL
ncbi:transport and golgi organization protein 6 family member [Holotrichia oblita]|uniref:Transport and golgi organization protein 6 family member n=1 Tax=Holotrichia oblita TaxID=644536 RepID=A0ACB9TBJ0_HOLOL|nr:transport and golgi organization protein 6 family member [Holotrichia oblita]